MLKGVNNGKRQSSVLAMHLMCAWRSYEFDVPASPGYRPSTRSGGQGNKAGFRCRPALCAKKQISSDSLIPLTGAIPSHIHTLHMFDRSGRGQLSQRRGWHGRL